MGAAPALWAFSQGNKSFDGKVAKAGSRFDDKDWTGFSSERWSTWSQRFAEIQDRDAADKVAQYMVTQARGAMSDAEKQ